MRTRWFGAVVGMILGSWMLVFAQSWTTPKTFSQGELVTPSHLNTHLRDNLTVLRAGGLAITSQSGRIPYGTSATQLGTSASLAFDGTNFVVPTEFYRPDATSYIRLSGGNAADSGGWIAVYGQSHATAANQVTLDAPSGINVTGYYNSASAQPGFLAYNSANDASVADAATIDFDTEAYDIASNFAADVFTAPVTGYYTLSANVGMTPDSSSSFVGADLVIAGTSAATYRLGQSDVEGVVDSLGVGGSLTVHMTATDTAKITLVSTDSTVLVLGGASPRVTWFSGRLVP